MQSIAIFGGCFDPIHQGHLKISLRLQAYFGFSAYIFLPCKNPTMKAPPLANSQQRVKMIELAIKNYPHCRLDLREIERDSPSYMVETLKSFRQEYPTDSMTLILGYDAFLSLSHWHQWEKIITLAHLLVINRSTYTQKPPGKIISQFIKKYQNRNKQALLNTQAGSVFLFDAGDYAISSTLIRETMKQGQNPGDKLLPDQVYEYIKAQGLYQ